MYFTCRFVFEHDMVLSIWVIMSLWSINVDTHPVSKHYSTLGIERCHKGSLLTKNGYTSYGL